MVSKVFGFLRDVILSYYYGASNISDAYLIAMTIPTTIFAFIGVAITTSYIPIYLEIVKKKSYKKGIDFTNNLLNILLMISFFIIFIVLVFTDKIVWLFASGFDNETIEVAVFFTRICIISIIPFSLVYIFSAYLQSKSKFYVMTLIGLPLNMITILSIYLSSKINIYYLPIGSVLAIFSQLIFLIPIAIKNQYSYSFKTTLKSSYVKKVFILSLPVILGTSISQINMLVDRTLASQVVDGGISALSYANKINLFIQGIFIMPLVTIFYTNISKLAINQDIKSMKKILNDYITVITIFILPIIVLTMIFSKEIVRILFGRGAFDEQAIALTSAGLFFYSFGMLGMSLREVVARVFYSLQDTKTPMINGAIGVLINIILNFLLVKYMGIGGLALATSISATIIVFLLFYSLNRKTSLLDGKYIINSSLKVTFSACVAGLICFYLYQLLIKIEISIILSIILSITIYGIVYLVLLFLLKINSFLFFINFVSKKYSERFLNRGI